MNQPRKIKLLFFGLCSEEGKMFTRGDLKASEQVKAVTSRSAEMSGSGLFVRNRKSNAVIVKTGILYHFPTMLSEIT
jgi:hypothetical protein